MDLYCNIPGSCIASGCICFWSTGFRCSDYTPQRRSPNTTFCMSDLRGSPNTTFLLFRKPVDQKQMQPEAMQGPGMLQYGSILKDKKNPRGWLKIYSKERPSQLQCSRTNLAHVPSKVPIWVCNLYFYNCEQERVSAREFF